MRLAFSPREVFVNLALLALGSLIYVIGLKGVLMPMRFLNGGVMGVALIIIYLFPGLSMGLTYALLNLPLFLLGWFKVSHKFIHYTGIGILIFSIMSDWVPVSPFSVTDPMLAAILAGIICGVGGGIILRSAGSVGGLDILSVYLNRRFDVRVGATSGVVNSLILLAAAFFFTLQAALYTAVFVFVQSRVLDMVITGFNRRKSVIIVSDKADELAKALMDHFQRGATFLEGTGAYSGRHKRVIFFVVIMTEMARLKHIVQDVDADAFMVINDTLDVLGSTFGHRRGY